MPVIGLNIDKIDAEKTNKISGKVEIKNNLSITEIEQEKLAIGNSEEVLKFNFKYGIGYEPKIGKIELTGNVLYMEDPKQIKEVIESWKKDKKISKELTTAILNTILAKCNVKALNLSQEINLPPHIRLPLVSPTKK
tara:strand:- start:645 stop:1055 length:411 start_codon:yes stop_codon:yes gene_type:complete